ncbi:MAG: hypothetical protein ACYSU0_18510 [Planctomycetota bacterium]
MFDIAVKRPIVEDDSGILAQITIGEFRETFCVNSPTWTPDDFEKQWHRTVKRLVCGGDAACLVTWHTPEALGRGWVLYRDASNVHVQEMLFVDPMRPRLAEDGAVVDIPARTTATEEDQPVSEWCTSTDELTAFLDREPGATLDPGVERASEP